MRSVGAFLIYAHSPPPCIYPPWPIFLCRTERSNAHNHLESFFVSWRIEVRETRGRRSGRFTRQSLSLTSFVAQSSVLSLCRVKCGTILWVDPGSIGGSGIVALGCGGDDIIILRQAVEVGWPVWRDLWRDFILFTQFITPNSCSPGQLWAGLNPSAQGIGCALSMF